MGQIAVTMLAGVCSIEAGQLWLIERSANFSDEVTEGRSSVRWKRNELNEKVGL